jgi:hypothetical protein
MKGSDMKNGESKSANGTGTRWRVLSGDGENVFEVENKGALDEVVLDDWFHLEHMDGPQWWLRVGDARIWVSIDEAGRVQVDVERGSYSKVNGTTVVSRESTSAP